MNNKGSTKPAGDNHLSERQALMVRLLDAVKQCQIRFGGRTELASEQDSRVCCLCAAWEAVLQHGLKHTNRALSTLKQVTEMTGLAKIGTGFGILEEIKNMETEPAFWQYVREHVARHEQQRFSVLQQVNTEEGRGRAWLRSALNEHSLEKYMHMLIENQLLLTQYYEDWAFLRDQERCSMLPNMAGGLGSIVFAITIDNADLNAIKPATGLDSLVSSAMSTSLPAAPQPSFAPVWAPEPQPVIGGEGSPKEKRKERKKRKKVAKIVSFDEDASSYSASPASSVTSPLSKSSSFDLSSAVVQPVPRKQAVHGFDNAPRPPRNSSLPNFRSASLDEPPVTHAQRESAAPVRTMVEEDYVPPRPPEPRSRDERPARPSQRFPGASDALAGVGGAAGRWQDVLGMDEPAASSERFAEEELAEVLGAGVKGIEDVEDTKRAICDEQGTEEGDVFSAAKVEWDCASLEDNDARGTDVQPVDSKSLTSGQSDISESLGDDFETKVSFKESSLSEQMQENESARSNASTASDLSSAAYEEKQSQGSDRLAHAAPSTPDNTSIYSNDVLELKNPSPISPASNIMSPDITSPTSDKNSNITSSTPDKNANISSTPAPIPARASSPARPVPEVTKDISPVSGVVAMAMRPRQLPSGTSVDSADARSNTSYGSFSSTGDAFYGTMSTDLSLMPVNAEGRVQMGEAGDSSSVTESLESGELGAFHEATESAMNAVVLAHKGLLSSLRTQGDGGNTADSPVIANDTMTTGELKQAVIAMMARKDEVEEQNKSLRLMVECEAERSAALRLELDEQKKQHQGRQEADTERIREITRENDLLKHQLRKYVGAVQMLRRQGASDDEFPGLHLDRVQPQIPASSARVDYSHEASQYEHKLVQVAEMHGELIELNEHLQRQGRTKDALIQRMRTELEDLRGPLPQDVSLNADTHSIHSLDSEINSRALINVWIPSAFLRGSASDSYHVYQVFVRVRDEEWNVYRRYTEFRDLHAKLRKLLPPVAALDFPPKKTIGHKDARFVEQRRKKLQTYLRKTLNLLNHANPDLGTGDCRKKLIATLPFFSDQPLADKKQKKQERSKGRSRSGAGGGGRGGRAAATSPTPHVQVYDGL